MLRDKSRGFRWLAFKKQPHSWVLCKLIQLEELSDTTVTNEVLLAKPLFQMLPWLPAITQLREAGQELLLTLCHLQLSNHSSWWKDFRFNLSSSHCTTKGNHPLKRCPIWLLCLCD